MAGTLGCCPPVALTGSAAQSSYRGDWSCLPRWAVSQGVTRHLPGSCTVPCVSSLLQVVSIEKMEDTSLLPNPIIVSIRSKMAFQFIELKDRENLVEGLLLRLKQVHANHPARYDASPSDDMVGAVTAVLSGGWGGMGPPRGIFPFTEKRVSRRFEMSVKRDGVLSNDGRYGSALGFARTPLLWLPFGNFFWASRFHVCVMYIRM